MTQPSGESQPVIFDLNAAFGKALVQQFFEPVLVGRSSDGQPYYNPSGVSIMAQSLFREKAAEIMDEVWERLDLEVLATKIASLVVAELIKAPTTYSRNTHQEKLSERVLEIVAQQLGQRVVDQMDLHIGPKEIEPTDEGDRA